ncbi:MAG: HAMP domain-containing sensor histidine kinase [Pseudomonadota bacterium]|nr:HAMP domain-containing sensor histidine kinase [Pseudomonadota bacterium]
MDAPAGDELLAALRRSEGGFVRFKRGLVERYGPRRAAVWATLVTTVISVVTSLIVYEIFDIDFVQYPVAVVMPVVLPMLTAYPTLLVVHRLIDGMIERERLYEQLNAKLAAKTSEAEARRQEADAANRAKSDMLASMSHELRTPLNAIIGFAEIMEQQGLGPMGDHRYAQYSGDIAASGRHLLSLVNDLLDLAKIERGAMEYHFEPIDICETIEQAVQLMRNQAAAASLTLAMVPAPAPVTVNGDDRAMRQMLLNLLSNAIKFTPAGGSVEAGCGTDARGPYLFVRDTGIGIPPEQQQLVFEPFRQVSGVLTRTHQGTGLGLALVKAMMERHDGTIELDSTVGGGTTVTLRFPPATAA